MIDGSLKTAASHCDPVVLTMAVIKKVAKDSKLPDLEAPWSSLLSESSLPMESYPWLIR